jgi:hypothetical protein
MKANAAMEAALDIYGMMGITVFPETIEIFSP